MALRPRTLYGQLLLALLVGMVVTQLFGAWLMVSDRGRFADRVRGRYAAERLATIASTLERTAPAERPRLLQFFDEPPNIVTLGRPWRQDGTPVDPEFASTLRTALGHAALLQQLPPEVPPLPPRLPDLRLHRRHPLPPFAAVQVRLSDGTVLTWYHAGMPQPRDWPARALWLLWIMALIAALLVGWTVRRLTRPLAALADAATGLARNLDQPPLAETGTREVARAAAAFNAMQRDLQNVLATRAQALAGVSHDLRLPLTRIRLRLEQIDDETLRGKIAGDLAEMDRMIGHTLEYLRAGDSHEPAVRLNLDALIESLAEDFEALGATVRIEGHIGSPVTARPQALRRCLGNLLENARRYAGNDLLIVADDDARQVTIRVEDRGPGIPEAQLERVFEPYVRLETSRARATGGTGLGLATARAIARAQGGELTLSPRDGGGLVATLTLPRR